VNKYVELYTIIFPIENSKSRDGIQYEGLCPFHDDNSNSFGWRADNGVCFCFVGCIEKGGAYDYAVKNGMDEIEARKYFKDYKDGGSSVSYDRSVNSDLQKPTTNELEQKIQSDVKNLQQLKNPPDSLKKRLAKWNTDLIKDWRVGWDKYYKALTIPNCDLNGKPKGIFIHKKSAVGDCKNTYFPQLAIFNYDRDLPFHMVEGLTDVISGNSAGMQTLCCTAGARSVPMKIENGKKVADVDVFKYCNAEIHVTFDNDAPGVKGGKNISQLIKAQFPDSKVLRSIYRGSTPKGFDLTDAFVEPALWNEFEYALFNAQVVPKQKQEKETNNEEYEGYELMDLTQFQAAEFEPQFALIDDLMDKSTITVFAGDEGVGKSWCILSAGLSLASGVPLFDFFEIQPGYDNIKDDSDE